MNYNIPTFSQNLQLPQSALVPTVIEQTGRGERAYDIFSRLLNDRIVMLYEDVNHHTASLITSQLLYLESQDPDKDIYLYISIHKYIKRHI